MSGAVDDDESDIEAKLLVSAVELVRLIDGHLRILIAMQEHQRRILGIHMRDRAGQCGQLRHLIGQRTESRSRAGRRMLSPKGVDCARMVRRSEAP